MKRFLALTIFFSSLSALAQHQNQVQPQLVLNVNYKLMDRYCMDGSDLLLGSLDDAQKFKMNFRSDGKVVLQHPDYPTIWTPYRFQANSSTLIKESFPSGKEEKFSISTEGDRLTVVSELDADPIKAKRLCNNGGPIVTVLKVEQ